MTEIEDVGCCLYCSTFCLLLSSILLLLHLYKGFSEFIALLLNIAHLIIHQPLLVLEVLLLLLYLITEVVKRLLSNLRCLGFCQYTQLLFIVTRVGESSALNLNSLFSQLKLAFNLLILSELLAKRLLMLLKLH